MVPIEVYFATGNAHKFSEACLFLERHVPGLSLKQCTGDFPEIQARDLETVARFKIMHAIDACNGNVFMEDAGLFIPSLNGFPGVYSADVKRMLDCQGILNLLRDHDRVDDRAAYFEACMALYMRDTREMHVFKGRIDGHISFDARGSNGFGFDPVFVPREPPWNTLTFAEMVPAEKIKVSHRSRALVALARFLATA